MSGRSRKRGRARPRRGGAVRGWPTWNPASPTDGLRPPDGLANGIPGDATGMWGLFRWFQRANTTGSARYLAAYHTGATRGWAVFETAGAGAVTVRFIDGAGASSDIVLGVPVVGKFNYLIIELNVGGSEMAATLNGGTRVTQAITGYTPPIVGNRFAIGNRGTLTTGIGTDAGMNLVVGASGTVLTAPQRVVLHGKARMKAFPISGGGEGVGLVTDHRWLAHVLTDSLGASVLVKETAVANRYHRPRLAY